MITPLDVSSDAALVATVLLTINILLGLLLSARYNTVQSWPHKRLPIFDIHNWTAYVALVLILIHPLGLLYVTQAKFRFFDLLWPVHSPQQTLYNCLGAATFYCLVFVIVTSYFRSKLGSKNWKKLHYVSYAAAALMFAHGILTDPDLKNQPPDLLDGEKLITDICAALIIAATIWRIRYQPKKRAVGPSVTKPDYQPG
jgi:predicted ferric reductase